MNIKTLSFLAIFSASSSSAVTIFEDSFSSNTLTSNYTTQLVTYNATQQTVTIARTGGSNFLEIANSFDLDSANTTELTVSFNFAFGPSMFGSGFLVQYNDGTTGWQDIGSQAFIGTNSSDNVAVNPFSVTINEGGTYAFTNAASVRIIGTTNSGGRGYTFDDLTVSADSFIPEPSAALLGGLGFIFLLRRRRA